MIRSPHDAAPQRAARPLAGVGAALVLLTSLLATARADLTALVGLAAFTAWALLPYAVLWTAGPRVRWPGAVVGAGALAIAFELGIRLAVFVFPQGSTAAIALVFSPAVALLIVMPLGGLAGALIAPWVSPSRPAWLRLPVFAVALIALALVTLGLARPDLFPSTVLARQRALERIGPPGVRTGGERFTRQRISRGPGWRMAGDFDGAPGDEVAVIDAGQVQLFDVPAFTPRPPLPLAGEAARWNWFSRLAWTGGRLLRVDGGGGFQETQVYELDGTLRFRYHPDPQLPPNALRAADLDEDGDAEFYAATQDALVRLDASGAEAWRTPLRSGEIIALSPATALGPAWLVTQTYGEPLAIRDTSGHPLATVTPPGSGYRAPLGVVEWLGQRLLAFGGEQLTLQSVDGKTAFEWNVSDMTITGVQVVVSDAGTSATPLLVVLATADRDTHRSRLQLITPAREVVYDEVSEGMPQVLIAHAADGARYLLLGNADGLDVLAPAATTAGGGTPLPR